MKVPSEKQKLSVKGNRRRLALAVGVALAILFTGAFLFRWSRASRSPRGSAAGSAIDAASGGRVDSVMDGLSAEGMTPLMIAAREDDVVAIAGLLRAGAVVDRIDQRQGWTPLLHAIHKGALSAAAALLAAGADPNSAGGGEVPPLFFAVMNGDLAMVRLLLDRGADPRATIAGGDTNALLLAVEGGFLADVDRGGHLLGSCQDEIVGLLLGRAPDLRLPGSFESRFAMGLVRLHGCKGTLALLATPRKAAAGS
ncbi:MAG: ankyrin repeat domain-containing protein [Thermoanaerobaculia bacterium]